MPTSSLDKNFIIHDDKVADKLIEQITNPEQTRLKTPLENSISAKTLMLNDF